MDRFEVFLANFLVGEGYQALVNYAQDVVFNGFRRFNYGPIENVSKYGTREPPSVDLSLVTVPTALVSGQYDKLADPEDVAWLATQLSEDTLVFNQQYPLGHLSFGIAKDMSWFSDDVMSLIAEYATNDFA